MTCLFCLPCLQQLGVAVHRPFRVAHACDRAWKTMLPIDSGSHDSSRRITNDMAIQHAHGLSQVVARSTGTLRERHERAGGGCRELVCDGLVGWMRVWATHDAALLARALGCCSELAGFTTFTTTTDRFVAEQTNLQARAIRSCNRACSPAFARLSSPPAVLTLPSSPLAWYALSHDLRPRTPCAPPTYDARPTTPYGHPCELASDSLEYSNQTTSVPFFTVLSQSLGRGHDSLEYSNQITSVPFYIVSSQFLFFRAR